MLFSRLASHDPAATAAFGRHVHWGCWPDPARADGSAEDYAGAAEEMCRRVTAAADVGDGLRLLDVGCGFGGTIASLNERHRGLDLVGLNVDPRQLERARATVLARPGNRVSFVEGDACDLPFPAGSFDVVTAVECVFHFPSREKFLAEACRVLRPGGRLALSDFVPTDEALPGLRQADPGTNPTALRTYGRLDLLCPLRQYRKLASAAGLRLEREQDVTEQTLPTYRFLRTYFRAWHDAGEARAFEKATKQLEVASQMGWLRYTVLGFRKAEAA
jgi:SAM-dependent methyltransferase